MRKFILLTSLMPLIGCSQQGHQKQEQPTPLTRSTTDPWGFPIFDPARKRVGMAFTRLSKDGVTVMVDVVGLSPGAHGVHIHQVPKCEGPRFESAGGHWNWTNKKHGHQNPLGHHAGDLGNVTVGTDGRGNATFHIPAEDWDSNVTGSLPIVIHAAADDERTDPSGNSGERIACGLLYVRKDRSNGG